MKVDDLAPADRQIVSAITIDVEDYFQVWALSPYIPRTEWDTIPCRIERNMNLVLSLFAEANVKATFFTLGWIAERYPGIVRNIVEQGHELASHGYAHHRATEQVQGAFLADIKLAKAVLEDISGEEVTGYRAPNFSIGSANPWAFDCIAEAGYRYSSSIYPVRHDHYGVPDAPRFAYEPRPGLLELPLTTHRMLGSNIPAGGGGYFRLLPYPLSRWLIRKVTEGEGRSAIFYFHPWELDPDQPRVPGIKAKARFRHYVNIHRTEARLRRLLSDFRWDRVDAIFLR